MERKLHFLDLFNKFIEAQSHETIVIAMEGASPAWVRRLMEFFSTNDGLLMIQKPLEGGDWRTAWAFANRRDRRDPYGRSAGEPMPQRAQEQLGVTSLDDLEQLDIALEWMSCQTAGKILRAGLMLHGADEEMSKLLEPMVFSKGRGNV